MQELDKVGVYLLLIRHNTGMFYFLNEVERHFQLVYFLMYIKNETRGASKAG